MAENIEQMRARHDREIESLQKSCEHKRHHRSAYLWAPGHLGNDVEVCDDCGKILETYNDGYSVFGGTSKKE